MNIFFRIFSANTASPSIIDHALFFSLPCRFVHATTKRRSVCACSVGPFYYYRLFFTYAQNSLDNVGDGRDDACRGNEKDFALMANYCRSRGTEIVSCNNFAERGMETRGVYYGTLRFLMGFYGFDGVWWILMDFDEVWWSLMGLVGFDGFWWVLMDFDGVLVDFDGFWWGLMGFGGFWWVWWVLMEFDGVWWVYVTDCAFGQGRSVPMPVVNCVLLAHEIDCKIQGKICLVREQRLAVGMWRGKIQASAVTRVISLLWYACVCT